MQNPQCMQPTNKEHGMRLCAQLRVRHNVRSDTLGFSSTGRVYLQQSMLFWKLAVDCVLINFSLIFFRCNLLLLNEQLNQTFILLTLMSFQMTFSIISSSSSLHWWLKLASYTLFKTSPVVFHKRKNVKLVLYDMRMSKCWQNDNFQMNRPFKQI